MACTYGLLPSQTVDTDSCICIDRVTATCSCHMYCYSCGCSCSSSIGGYSYSHSYSYRHMPPITVRLLWRISHNGSATADPRCQWLSALSLAIFRHQCSIRRHLLCQHACRLLPCSAREARCSSATGQDIAVRQAGSWSGGPLPHRLGGGVGWQQLQAQRISRCGGWRCWQDDRSLHFHMPDCPCRWKLHLKLVVDHVLQGVLHLSLVRSLLRLPSRMPQ